MEETAASAARFEKAEREKRKKEAVVERLTAEYEKLKAMYRNKRKLIDEAKALVSELAEAKAREARLREENATLRGRLGDGDGGAEDDRTARTHLKGKPASRFICAVEMKRKQRRIFVCILRVLGPIIWLC